MLPEVKNKATKSVDKAATNDCWLLSINLMIILTIPYLVYKTG